MGCQFGQQFDQFSSRRTEGIEPVRDRTLGEKGVEHIDQRRIGKRAVLLEATASQSREAPAGCPGADFGDEATFADPGFAADEDTAPSITLNSNQGVVKLS
jgi:hypothetical protein